MSEIDVKFFLAESLKLARQMTIPDARRYLAGLLEAIEDHDMADAVRRAVVHLDESDRQLQLLCDIK